MPRRPIHSGLLTLALVWGCLASTGPSPAISSAVSAQQAPAAAATPVALPNREGSLKFAVLGDWGNGSRQQLELAAVMAKVQERFAYEIVITVGDNIYGSNTPRALRERFEEPYKVLLDRGIKFYASLGNHDARELQRYYKLFNMEGKFY